MATTLKQISTLLEGSGINHVIEGTYIEFHLPTEQYVNLRGENKLLITLELKGAGTNFIIEASVAYRPKWRQQPLFLFACAIIELETKLVQFKLTKYFVYPVIELYLHGTNLTQEQLVRCINEIVSVTERFHQVLQDCMTHGTIAIAAKYGSPYTLNTLLDAMPIELLEATMRKKQEE